MKNNLLIVSDLHLVDTKAEEYRWKIFDYLRDVAKAHNFTDIIIAGDFVDRKDRHSSVLVNRIVESLIDLRGDPDYTEIYILAGNHDQPINGPYFWEFLNEVGINYLTKPFILDTVYLLPFSSNPVSEWKNLDFKASKALIMHQTGQGATVENGRELVGNNLPVLPPIPCFSGDVHRPQEANGVVYVGAPYPVKFSESWSNRIILVKDSDFKNYESIPIDIMQRAILDISSSDELDNIKYKPGCQWRVRYKLARGQLTKWPIEEATIREWCTKRGIELMSIEAVFEGEGLKPEVQASQIERLPPEEIIKMFCKEEKLSEEILEVGLSLVKESK